ncbi:Ribonuclease BN, partial [Lacticaseibacillus paracasei subsp. paracasei Lpp70]
MARKQHQKKPPLLSAEQEVAIQSGRAAIGRFGVATPHQNA